MNERRILALLKTGQVAFRYPLKVHFAAVEGTGDFGVSVPKRLFKRAVKRNLLKRRIRESYRTRKELLAPGTDVMFIYQPKEILSYPEICSAMETALKDISAE